MGIKFETEHLICRDAEIEDISYIMDIEKHPDYNRFIWQGTYEEHVSEVNSPDYFFVVFIEKESEEKVGYCLSEITKEFDVFELRRIAMTKKGQGLGKEAMIGIFEYAFNKLDINRLWLDVYPDNTVGIKLYEGLHMHKDGELRQSYKSDEGEYRNQIVYSILKSEWSKDKSR